MKKTLIIALSITLLFTSASQADIRAHCVPVKSIARVLTSIKNSANMIAGLAILGGITYGVYRLFYRLLHTPDKKYYEQASRFVQKTDVHYSGILNKLNRADLDTLKQETLPDDKLLVPLAETKKLPIGKQCQHLQKTVTNLSDFAHFLEKRANSLKNKTRLSAQEQTLSTNMTELSTHIKTNQLNPLENLQKILKLHKPFFAVYDRAHLVRTLYATTPKIPDDFAVNNNGELGYINYTSQLSGELGALKRAQSKALEKYPGICSESEIFRVNLKERIHWIRATQTHKDQVEKQWWDRALDRIQHPLHIFIPSKN
jgi:hypothetical protein